MPRNLLGIQEICKIWVSLSSGAAAGVFFLDEKKSWPFCSSQVDKLIERAEWHPNLQLYRDPMENPNHATCSMKFFKAIRTAKQPSRWQAHKYAQCQARNTWNWIFDPHQVLNEYVTIYNQNTAFLTFLFTLGKKPRHSHESADEKYLILVRRAKEIKHKIVSKSALSLFAFNDDLAQDFDASSSFQAHQPKH